MNLRGGRWGEAIVAVAGPISNLVLAIAAAIPLRYIIATGMDVPLLAAVLFLFIEINLLLMVFNLIPIPPLDGSKVLYAFLDPRTRLPGPVRPRAVRDLHPPRRDVPADLRRANADQRGLRRGVAPAPDLVVGS